MRTSLPSACAAVLWLAAAAGAGEPPPALNPFGSPAEARPDAIAGSLETSDGAVFRGRVYLTRDARLKIYDGELKRHREVPLSAVREIACQVRKEWQEREWRFRENASDEKVYTGRSYPARIYEHTITLRSGRTITGPLSAVVYVAVEGQPAPVKFVLHKRQRGPVGSSPAELIYVRRIELAGS